MPARSVDEIWIRNWEQTGVDVRIPQYQFDLEIKWTDQDGNKHQHSDRYRYPNDIASMPLAVRRQFAEEMIITTARVTLGIDDWEDHA